MCFTKKTTLNSPINYSFVVEELQSGNYFGPVESSPVLLKSSRSLNVPHQVSAVQIFHDEEKMRL